MASQRHASGSAADADREVLNKVDTRAEPILSPELKEFYKQHHVDGVEDFLSGNSIRDGRSVVLPRFVRLNPRFDKIETLNMLKNEVQAASCVDEVTPVPWLDKRFGFYSLSGAFKLSQSKVFQAGRVVGMDASSGAAVATLLFDQYHDDRLEKQASGVPTDPSTRVLDLCCCPGLKLSMMADLVSRNSTVIGVDVSESRMATCKRILSKYHIHPDTSGDSSEHNRTRIRLYQTDGTTFGVAPDPDFVFDSQVAIEEASSAGKRKRINKSAKARQRRRLKELSSIDRASSDDDKDDDNAVARESRPWIQLFDYVLVDAECSTDGSLKHVQHRLVKQQSKFGEPTQESDTATPNNIAATNPTLTDMSKLEQLVDLQKRLIASGFRLLKPGGGMVYSTCSLSEDQNEGVVRWLLKEKPKEAALVPLAFPLLKDSAKGSLPGTVRFLPNLRDGSGASSSGFFIAKIEKIK